MQTVTGDFLNALRWPHAVAAEVDVYLGAAKQNSTPIPIIDGSVTVDASSKVRRTLDLTIDHTLLTTEQADALYNPFGRELHVRAGVRFPNGAAELVPVGVFRYDADSDDVTRAGGLKISAPDRARAMQDNRFIEPKAADAVTIPTQIQGFITSTFPGLSLQDATGSTAATPSAVWDADRWDACIDLATALAAEVFFRADGQPVLRALPQLTDSPVWRIDAGQTGVMVAGDRRKSRERTYSGVVVRGERTDGTPPVAATVWDTLTTSPTYHLGPFGKVPYFFCVDEDTEALTRRGWKRHSDLTDDDELYTLNPHTRLGEWQPLQRVSRFHVTDLPMLSIEARAHSSLTTADHRWSVVDRNNARAEWVTSRSLRPTQMIPCAAPSADLPAEPKWADALVELVGWYWTEGNDRMWNGHRTGGVWIYQSHRVNQDYCARIRACLTALIGPESSRPMTAEDTEARWREGRNASTGMSTFRINRHLGRVLQGLATDKVVGLGFLSELTAAQLRLFVSTSIDADGTRKASRAGNRPSEDVTQRRRDRLIPIEVACALLGIRTNLQQIWGGMWRLCLHQASHFNQGMLKGAKTTREYTGVVWCPRTANGTWLAKRNGTVYFTGNSSPFITDQSAAAGLANAMLPKHTSMQRQLTLAIVPNPALDAGDTIEVVFPDGRIERHLIERLTVPLTYDGAMSVATRSSDPDTV